MNHSKRAELFRQLRTKHAGYLASVLWKLTGDRELFTEAMQYALLGMWQHIEKLKGKKAPAYIYRIVLTANSKAWRDAKQSKAIVMRYLEQQDYGNIAAQLRCTQASARSHVSKAIATLKGKLATLAEQEL